MLNSLVNEVKLLIRTALQKLIKSPPMFRLYSLYENINVILSIIYNRRNYITLIVEFNICISHMDLYTSLPVYPIIDATLFAREIIFHTNNV